MMITIAQIIAQVESAGKPFEMRFEPSVYAGRKSLSIIDTIIQANDCDKDTATVFYAMSFGLYQIMGYNLYDPSGKFRLRAPIATYMNDAKAQLAAFNAFTAGHDAGWDGERFDNAKGLEFARFYNGPGNVAAYFNAMKAAAQKLLG